MPPSLDVQVMAQAASHLIDQAQRLAQRIRNAPEFRASTITAASHCDSIAALGSLVHSFLEFEARKLAARETPVPAVCLRTGEVRPW